MNKKLRVLFLSANVGALQNLRKGGDLPTPDESAPLGSDKEFKYIEAIRRKAQFRDEIEPVIPEPAVDILHFSGHGRETGEIQFVSDYNAAEGISAELFRDIINTACDNLKLVVLNNCHSHHQAELIKEKVGCVVGTVRAIADKAAVAFSEGFYEAIFAGLDVAKAFDHGNLRFKIRHGDLYQAHKIVHKILHRKNVEPGKLVFLAETTTGPKLNPLVGALGKLNSIHPLSFVCRDAEIRALEEFVAGEQTVAWQLWLGAAGTGKTRLALEFCRKIDRTWEGKPGAWKAGFLNFRLTAGREWRNWNPPGPMLIVVDYVEEHAADVVKYINEVFESATRKRDFPKVRFLLLNRDKDSDWYKDFAVEVHQDRSNVDHTAFVAVDGRLRCEWELEPFNRTDLGLFVTAAIKDRGNASPTAKTKPPTADQIVADITKAKWPTRPLFVALAVEAAFEGCNIAGMNHLTLAHWALDRELDKWKDEFSDGDEGAADMIRHATLVALATFANRLNLSNGYRNLHKQLDEASNFGIGDYIPSANSVFTLVDKKLNKLYSRGMDEKGECIPALYPDYLGELFVLDHLKSRLTTGNEQRAFVNAGLMVNSKAVLDFMRRAVQNHLGHPSIKLLLERAFEVTKKRNKPWPSWPSDFDPGSFEQKPGFVEQQLGAVAKRLGHELEWSFYEAAVSAHEVSPWVLWNVALYRSRKNDQVGALKLLGRMKTTEQLHAVPLVSAAALCIQFGDKPTGQYLLHRLLTMERADAQSLVSAAYLLSRKLDDKPTAKAMLDRLKKMEDVNVHAVVEAAFLLAGELDDKFTASNFLDRLKTMEGIWPHQIVLVASLLASKLGNEPVARQYLEQLMSNERVKPNVIVAAARVFIQDIRDKATARKHLERLKTMEDIFPETIIEAAELLIRCYRDGPEAAKELLLRLTEPALATKGVHWMIARKIATDGLKDEVLAKEYEKARKNCVRWEQKSKISWEYVAAKYPIGSKHLGEVVNIQSWGAYIRLEEPDIDGLVQKSEMSWAHTKDPTKRVSIGDWVEVQVLNIDMDDLEISLSMKQARPDPWDNAEERFLPNTRVEGTVSKFEKFGALIEIEDGIEGLLHNEEMSWVRKIKNPSAVLKEGEKVRCIILTFHPAKRGYEKPRITLSHKRIANDPWESEIPSRYHVGDTIKGKVTKITSFGAFVGLEPPGLEGLLHISQLTDGDVENGVILVKPDQELEVRVLRIDLAERKIGLSRRPTSPADDKKSGPDLDTEHKPPQTWAPKSKQPEQNPWDKIAQKYPPGTQIEGVVSALKNYGAFIEIDEGIEGLLDVSDMSWVRTVGHPSEMLTEGQKVKCIILNVDQERKRVGLGLKQMSIDPWPGYSERYHCGDVKKGKVTKFTNFGVFVELEPGLEGLLHISELADQKVESPEGVVKVGDEIEFKILRVDPAERKIGLSRKRLHEAEPEEGAAGEAPIRPKDREGGKPAKGAVGEGLSRTAGRSHHAMATGKLACPYCQSVLKPKGQLRGGLEVTCPQCRAKFKVAGPDESSDRP